MKRSTCTRCGLKIESKNKTNMGQLYEKHKISGDCAKQLSKGKL